MGTVTFKICDRCGAQFKGEDGPVRTVQRVQYVVPTSTHLHTVDYRRPTEKELCQPCRVGLHNLIQTYMEGPR